jgi:hypothetical protein
LSPSWLAALRAAALYFLEKAVLAARLEEKVGSRFEYRS